MKLVKWGSKYPTYEYTGLFSTEFSNTTVSYTVFKWSSILMVGGYFELFILKLDTVRYSNGLREIQAENAQISLNGTIVSSFQMFSIQNIIVVKSLV